VTAQATRAGFFGGVVVDFPNSTKAKKFFLVLMTGGAMPMPKALGTEDDRQQAIMTKRFVTAPFYTRLYRECGSSFLGKYCLSKNFDFEILTDHDDLRPEESKKVGFPKCLQQSEDASLTVFGAIIHWIAVKRGFGAVRCVASSMLFFLSCLDFFFHLQSQDGEQLSAGPL